MKIVFVCSSLEPGRDGVGDYTRQLSIELIKQGHVVSAIALNDKHVKTLSKEQFFKNLNFPILRLPADWKSDKKFEFAQKWIESFNPDWISLQFVIFGFQSKGLPFGIIRPLFNLGKNRQWHVMFHELWVGMALEEPKKLLLWGLMQRYLIKFLLIKLHPKVIQTQTLLYQTQLSKLGFNAGYLPLFGNIPVINKDSIKSNEKCRTLLNKDEIDFVIFGSIHSGAPVAEFAKEAALYSLKKNVRITLTFIGRCGSEQDRWSAAWKSEGLSVKAMGEQSVECISEMLTKSTIGISATAIAVIEKSGSFAAMREHGLPVFSVSKPWSPRGMPQQKIPAGIVEYRIGNLEACLANIKYTPYNNKVSDVSNNLINSLLNAN